MTNEIFFKKYEENKNKRAKIVCKNFKKEGDDIMQINTKYEIGQHIWVVDIHNQGGELFLYDTYIVAINIDKDGMIYMVDDENYTEVKEEDIILYEDKNKLCETIYAKMIEANKILGN